jgi:glutamate-1-semialdehyde 2,1-aminomutase
MLDRGIALAPGAYEAIFPSLAHGDEEIEATVAACAKVAATL